MLRGPRHCQPITTWDGLGPLLIIAKAFHMVRSRSFRGCTLRKPTIRLGERWWRRGSEGRKPRVPGLPAGVYAAVAWALVGPPRIFLPGVKFPEHFLFGNMLARF